MRKYSRAVLVVIATISLVALIFYRHEYNKLRFVLEAFNYFGPPGAKPLQVNCSSLLIASENITPLEHKNYHFDEPIPSWQRINDDAYIYSAFELNDREIRAVAFARAKILKLLICEIYHENELQPVVGNFTYKIIESSSSIDNNGDVAKKGIYNAYHLICMKKNENVDKKRVAGISFVIKNQRPSDAVILQVKSLEINGNESNETALCVAPISSRPILEIDMTNFISFHNAIGIRHFIVYDFGVPQRYNNIFKSIARILNSTELNFSYTSLPWNFPIRGISNDVIRKIVQADCRYRMYKNVGIVGTLNWDEYIVMKYHRTISKLFREMEETKFFADRYKVSTTNFCTEREEGMVNNKTEIIVRGSGTVDQNRPIFLDRSKNDERFVNDDDLKIRETTSEVILVNRYERQCNRILNLVPQDNPYVGKFDKNIQTSPIFKLFQIYAH